MFITIVAITIRNPKNKKKVQINALLDEGANRTSMSTNVAKMLGLTGRQIVFRASGFGDSFMQDPDAMEMEVIISDAGESFAYKTHIICIANPLGNLTPNNWKLLKQDWPHLKDLTIARVLVDEQVQMIIGTDNVHLLAAREGDIIGPDGGPGAQRTVFGWVARDHLFPEQAVDLVNLFDDTIESVSSIPRVASPRHRSLHATPQVQSLFQWIFLF
jgi:hypothetical protein